ncbi:RDD family protein [Candidatus Accumulibacter contiguus]|jgi:uncharacterized RDD family membrane protein YckC|uniref:RDD family protein n=1 Tax=Candidatus Accumulibacter contiguus TaxID=2954381 RepID=UPI002FC37F92
MAALRKPSSGRAFLRRLLSMFYESLLLLAVLAVLLVSAAHSPGRLRAPWRRRVLLQAHCFLVMLIYFLWFWSNGRRTLAMKTWRIRLVTRDGLPVRPARALLRYLLSWPSIVLGGAGILWALFDRDRQFLHDRLAGTQLIIN